MILVADANSRGQLAADLADMHCQRKMVFVDRARWKVPVIANLEIDRYDLLDDTTYLLAKSERHGPLLASVRLLTTTGPHLMQDLFSAPHRAALPSGPMVWEASRYCAAPGISGRGRRLSLLWEIICGVMELGLAQGIQQVIFAANRALLPLALECGWDARSVGPTCSDGNDEVTAVAAAVTAQGLRDVRLRHGVPAPVIQPWEASECTTGSPASPTLGPPEHTSAP